MSNVAQCPECKKKYKVPHLDKAWQCKACNVPLTLPEAASPEAKPEPKKRVSTTCPACGAVVAGRSSACKECGERMGEDPYASPKHSGRPAHERAAAGSRESIEQSAARGAAKKELRKLGFLRFLIMLGLFFSCIETIFDVMVLTAAADLLLPIVFW
jgi:ribosomal protein L37AE/L43A